ncbi:MAG TPA: PBP1A family penicillin-binding protein, partial [Bryobacteraceae bacterium]|nr:PBP1A family penicillin-binding protein [Bryobacteraceae bacterium]
MLFSPAGRIALGFAAVVALVCLVTFTVYYVRYSRLIDRKLKAGPFQSTSMVFAAPRVISLGDEVTPEEIIAQLRNSGYGESSGNRMGWFHLRGAHAVEIFPGPDSYFDDEAGVIKFNGSRVSQIISLRDNTDRVQYLLEPELITNLSDRNREKRRLVKFADIPKVLVDAVVSAEDKRFFQHAGFDPLRVIKAAVVDVRERRMEQGASTLSMQLARLFWLNQQKTASRKAAEVLITLQLEQKLSKEQIFEFYSNQVPLGRRGSFAIHGFGEASRAYFGKDISKLTLSEAATLAGLIQRPSWFNPYRHTDRARERRNIVLRLMRENGYITEAQYGSAVEEPLVLTAAAMESTEAPYFVDLVNDELQSEFGDYDFQTSSYRVYTTLDLNLQRAASEAVRAGMQEVDQRLAKRRWPAGTKPPQAQCALVALDPETGAIKALIGGRDYGASQLNRALAKRQPGSAFKPFVYAAALNTALNGAVQTFTPASRIMDEPTTFWYDDRSYSPENFKKEYYGEVTLRRALAKSLNIPTVKIAEAVGYDAVETLAKRAGMNINLRATPAIALGAYEVTPVEVAGSYTIYANQGTYVKPSWVSLIRDRQGNVLFSSTPNKRQVLDPRVAFMMTNMMEEVLRTGTGAGVRSRGFTLPAAGKTGTSHDGWFVGFTSKLICAVWVGFDDNRELGLEGAHSALPVWAEFMKRAHQNREYRNVHEFAAPDGIVSVEVDPLTGQLATPACPSTQTEVFLSGTQPVESCQLHGGTAGTRVASWETEPAQAPAAGAAGQAAGSAAAPPGRAAPAPPPRAAASDQTAAPQPTAEADQ